MTRVGHLSDIRMTSVPTGPESGVCQVYAKRMPDVCHADATSDVRRGTKPARVTPSPVPVPPG